MQAQLGTHRTLVWWTWGSVGLAEDPPLLSGQASFLEHQRVDSGAYTSPELDSLGPKSTPALHALGHPGAFSCPKLACTVSETALACGQLIPAIPHS